MTKAELIERVSQANPQLSRRAATALVDGIFDEIKRAIRKEKRFVVPGFGTFSLRTRKGRAGRNPQTGEKIEIPSTKTVGFKPAPDFKKAL